MTSQGGLIVLGEGLLTYLLLSSLYVAGSYLLARRFGTRTLPALWLIASFVFGGLALRRAYAPYKLAGPIHPGQLSIAIGLCLMFFLAFGFATLSVRSHLRKEPMASLTFGMVGRGVVAFFGGVAIVLVLFLVSDARRLSSR